MHAVIRNIKEGSVFHIERSNNKILKEAYISIGNHAPVSKTTYRGAIASDFKNALMCYKKNHKLE
jgi:hypothetical protein